MSEKSKIEAFALITLLLLFSQFPLYGTSGNASIPGRYNGIDLKMTAYPPKLSTSSSSNENKTDYFSVIITVGNKMIDERDVNNLVTTLVFHGWQEANIRVFSEQEATKQAIMTLPFEWLNINSHNDTDVILFYFSMHGGQTKDYYPLDEPDGKDEYLVPFDGEPDNDSNILLDDELAMKIKTLKSNNIILIFEACHSGGMIDGLHDLCASGRVILTSCKEDEYSWGLSIQKQWMFPYYLLKGLSGHGDTDEDDWVSAEEAFYFAEKPTIVHSTLKSLLYLFHPFARLGPQHPQLYDAWPSSENNHQELRFIPL